MSSVKEVKKEFDLQSLVDKIGEINSAALTELQAIEIEYNNSSISSQLNRDLFGRRRYLNGQLDAVETLFSSLFRKG